MIPANCSISAPRHYEVKKTVHMARANTAVGVSPETFLLLLLHGRVNTKPGLPEGPGPGGQQLLTKSYEFRPQS
jgi:hypothetical protein